MTRRETLGLLCAFPLLGLPLRVLANARPRTVGLTWDWAPGNGGSIEYFEVLVTSGDAAAGENHTTVTRVGGHLRSCQVPLPRGSADAYRARVRAVNAHGSSELSAPVTLSL